MADSVVLNPGDGGAKVATDLIDGLSHQLIKVEFGVDGTAVQVSSVNPLPVTTADVSALSKEVTQLLIKAKTDNIPALGQALATNSTPVVLTALQIAVLTPPAAITGFALASNQQNDAVTNSQLRAAPLSVVGSFFQAVQPISGAVNTGLSQPLTDAQIRATALPVSNPFFSNQTGTWGYKSGVSGTITLTGTKKIVGISAFSTNGGTMVINGGDSYPITASTGISITPQGNIIDPTIVFTGTISYFIEFIS